MILVDTAMVGVLGASALAAVGIASLVNFMCYALLTGLASGVLAISARIKGKGNHTKTAGPLNGGLLISFCVAIPLTIILYNVTPLFFPALHGDPTVVAQGNDYLQMRVLSTMAVAMNLSFRGYWNGIKMPKLYMKTLILIHVSNIGLNYLLIFGKFGFPEMGVAGAGLATTFSFYIGTIYCFYLGFKHATPAGFLKLLPTKKQLHRIINISLPHGIQQLFFATGLTTMFWIIGKIGVNELAAANVLVNISLVAILPCVGFGLAAASLVGEALGQSSPDDAKRWGWHSAMIGVLFMFSVSLPILLLPDQILSLFLHDPALIEIARLPLQLVSLLLAVDAVGVILLNALLGAGASKQVLKVSFGMQWLFFLPAAWFFSNYLGMGLLAIWCLNIVYRGIQTGIFVRIWHKGRWTAVQV